tara:strand:+ start:5452 stop:5790 length:339 start_codon:yes stop_codon:yes gene_type:complete
MCKHTDCVEVCPVDCFYEGENFLAINPDECIDCGVCEPECPVDAIKPDSHDEPDKDKWIEINKKYSSGPDRWPVLTKMIEQMEEAEKYNPDTYKEDKMSLLSEKPGPGDDGR